MSFTNNNWYIIKDLNEFIKKTRVIVFNSYASSKIEDSEILNIKDSEEKELDEVLSYQESAVIIKNLIKKQKNKKTQVKRFLVNDDIYTDIINSLGDRITSNILHNLVKKGLIDTAYDTDANDFIFWIKDNEEKDKKS